MAIRLDQIPEKVEPIRLDRIPEGPVRLDQIPKEPPTFQGGQGGEFRGQGTTGTWGPESFLKQTIGSLAVGSAHVGQALLEQPGQFVRSAGLIRQWSMAEDVLKETDPQKQEQLRQKMALSKQAFDQVADTVDKPAGEYQKGLNELIKNHPEWEHDPPESFVELLTNPKEAALAVAEALPLLVGAGIATATGHLNVAKALIFTGESKSMSGQTFQDTGDKDVAALSGLVYGAVSAQIEGMQLEGFIKITKGMYKPLRNRVVQKLASKGLKALESPNYGLIKTAIHEAMEEMAQQGWQEFTAKTVYGKDVPGGLAGFLDRQAQAGYLGFLLSGGAGVAGAGVGAVESIRSSVPITEAVEQGSIGTSKTGQPLSVEVFRAERVSPVTGERQAADAGFYGQGTYYSATEEGASRYGEAKAHKIELKNPLVVDTPDQLYTAIAEVSGPEFAVPPDQIARPKVSREISRVLKEQGYDGLIIKNPYKSEAPEIVVFDKTKPVAEVEPLPQAQAEPATQETQPINPETMAKEMGQAGDIQLYVKPDGTPVADKNVKYDKTEQGLQNPHIIENGDRVEVEFSQELSKIANQAYRSKEAKPAKMAEAKPSEPKTKLTKRQAQKLGHSLPKKLGWDDAQRRDFMQELVGRRTMKDMPLADMNTVVEALQQEARDRGLLPPEDYPKTLLVNGREVATDEFFENVEQAINDLPDLSQKQPKMRLRRQAERARGFLGSVKAVLTGIDNLSVPHLMRKIGAAKEGVFKEVGVTGWRMGIHQIASVFRGGVDMLTDAADAAGITPKDLAEMSSSADPRMELIKKGRELLGKPKTKEYKIEINGKKFSLEMGELMDMYLASFQDTGPKHIEKGGFEIRGYKTGPISETDMDSIRSIVEADPKTLALMNAAIKIADEYNAPQLNYTNGRLNPESPEPIADRKNYWHLEPKQPKKVKGKPTYSISLLENKNILKPRTGGNQPLVIRGFFNRFFAVQYAVSEYVGMAEQLRLMNMVLNHGPVMDALEAKGYTPIRDNLKQLLEWVQSKGSTATTTDKLVGRILHGSFRAVLHYSPEVILSQYMSTGHYMAYVDAKYAPLLAVPPTPAQIREMLDKNPVVWQRYYAGGQSAELAELGQLDVSLRLLTGKHADLNKTGIAAQLTDLAAFAQGWKLAKAIVQDTTDLEVGSPEFFDVVNDKAEELWDTQPSWDKWNKSINTSQRGIRRVPFLFRSYFEKSLMMLHSANATYQTSEKTAGDKAQWAKVYGAVLGSQMATALIRTFIGAALWRRRKTVWDYIGAMVAAPLAMVSIVGGYLNRVVGNVFKILAGEKQGFEGEPISTLPGKTVEEFLIGIGQVTDGVAEYAAGNEDQAKRKLKTGIDNITVSVGTAHGIPVRQMYKIKRALEKEDGPKVYGGGL